MDIITRSSAPRSFQNERFDEYCIRSAPFIYLFNIILLFNRLVKAVLPLISKNGAAFNIKKWKMNYLKISIFILAILFEMCYNHSNMGVLYTLSN